MVAEVMAGWGAKALTDLLIIIVAIVAIFFILKIAFKVLKAVLLLGVIALVLYYLAQYGFLNGIF
jgi:hypothetical protein